MKTVVGPSAPGLPSTLKFATTFAPSQEAEAIRAIEIFEATAVAIAQINLFVEEVVGEI